MTESYYDPTIHGTGIEGVLNYANTLTGGWFANLFLAFIWIAIFYVLSKSEWKLPGVFAFASFVTLITAWIMKLIMGVSEKVIFLLVIMTAIGVAWSLIEQNKR